MQKASVLIYISFNEYKEEVINFSSVCWTAVVFFLAVKRLGINLWSMHAIFKIILVRR